MSVLNVISVGFYRSETSPTEPGKLDDDVRSLLVIGGTNVNVGLFSHSDLKAYFLNDASLQEHFYHQVVIAHVGQSVSIVVFTSVEHHFVLQEELKDFVGV